MKQVVQPASGGPARVVEVPRPTIGPTEVLVRTVASVISPGTERAVAELARANLVAKARARPDLVRQVVTKARTEGVRSTMRSVRARLDDDLPLGYSAAGVAVAVGEAVSGIAPGQLVATGGAGKANHAELQAVPGLLCTPVPEQVAAADAAFSTLASVALHGLRLADVGPGSKVVVVGLGLVGQLAVRLAQAAGCDVAGIDVVESLVERTRTVGALGLLEAGETTTKSVFEWARSRGADAVLLTAATSSSSVIRRTPSLCRDRATVVVVGDVGLDFDRRPFYERELTLRFARSYGPGRHERSYEDWGVDYPAGLVRWTEGRNQEAVLDLLAAGRLNVDDLVTHRFAISEGAAAYELIEQRSEPYVGILFTYPDTPAPEKPIDLRPRRRAERGLGVGLIGAGAFATTVLVPAVKEAGFDRLVSVCSASGLSARRLGDRAGFAKAVAGADAVIDDPDVDVVVVATSHDAHAQLAARALRAGKHVFCEKPLALSDEELAEVEAAWRQGDGVLFVGFNRRWSKPVALVHDHVAEGGGPLVVTYRVNAGRLPLSHWYHDRRQGGRLLGEGCHFIDTCAAIVGSSASSLCVVGSGTSELLLDEDFAVALRYGDGSLAAVTYASGGNAATEKERVEVLGRGRSAAIVDFRHVVLDGRKSTLSRQDKGHLRELQAFRRAVLGEAADVTEPALASMRTALLAASALGQGSRRLAGGTGLGALDQEEPPEPVAEHP